MKSFFGVPLFNAILVMMLVAGCGDGTTQKKTIRTATNSIGMSLVRVPGGTFQMGDHLLVDAQPVHEVTVSSFWMGQFEVTNAQYDLFQKRQRFPESLTGYQPAVRVSWQDANKYCEWLSQKDGRRYRLPTEAEWEYAARGGLLQRRYPWGNQEWDGRATFGSMKTTRVGKYAPNAFGFYDMAGNASEWVSDWYDPNYYANSSNVDPQGPSKPWVKGPFRIVRGGLYIILQGECGFRVVMEIPRASSSTKSKS